MRAIAKEAGVSVGNAYYYFASQGTPGPGVLRPDRRRAPGGGPARPGQRDRSGDAARGRADEPGWTSRRRTTSSPRSSSRTRPTRRVRSARSRPSRSTARRGGDRHPPRGAGRGEDQGAGRTGRRPARVDVALADGSGPVLGLRPLGGQRAHAAARRARGAADDAGRRRWPGSGCCGRWCGRCTSCSRTSCRGWRRRRRPGPGARPRTPTRTPRSGCGSRSRLRAGRGSRPRPEAGDPPDRVDVELAPASPFSGRIRPDTRRVRRR